MERLRLHHYEIFHLFHLLKSGATFHPATVFLCGRCWLFVFTPMCSSGGEWIPIQSKNDSLFVNKIDGERVQPTSGTHCVYFLEADKKKPSRMSRRFLRLFGGSSALYANDRCVCILHFLVPLFFFFFFNPLMEI